jgi:hypothetical protein
MPLLREFDLDLPDDLGKRARFRNETRCVTALFERVFGKFKTEKYWKVLVECVREVKLEQYKNLLGVCVVQIPFSSEGFFDLNDHEKKDVALELLRNGVEKLINLTQWDKTPFDEAFDSVKRLEIMNVWTWKKPLKSPSKKLIAQVICKHEVTNFSISIVIRNIHGHHIMANNIIYETPNEFSYSSHLGELIWVSDTEIVLINKDKDNRWSVEIPEEVVP